MTEILIIEDEQDIADTIRDILLPEKYEISHFLDGESGLKRLEERHPDLLLLDQRLPGISGMDLMEKLKEKEILNRFPIIALTAYGNNKLHEEFLDAGVDDYVAKPFVPAVLIKRISNLITKRKALDELSKCEFNLNILDSQKETLVAFLSLAESRDPETGEHLVRIEKYCTALCHELRSYGGEYEKKITDDFINYLETASQIHDIGKVAIPDGILLKPAKFEESEKALMQEHSVRGAKVIEKVQEKCGENTFLKIGYDVCRHHHETWDGQGYPDGLAGREIPLSARIVSLADAYDAATSKRCYKDAKDHERFLEEMKTPNPERQQFDPTIVKVFIQIEKQFKEIKDNNHNK